MAEYQDWRTYLQSAARLRIIRKIMDTLKRVLPIPYPDALLELTKLAIRCEERVYTSAITQSDYLRQISLKMLTMETRGHNNNAFPYALPTNTSNPVVDMDNVRWQTLYQADSRLRIISKILDTSVEHHPLWGPAEFLEATQVAVRFEENVYTTASNEKEYLHRITLKILSMEVNDLL